MRKRLLVLMMAATMLAVSAAPALAQGKPEDVPRGQTEQGPEHARSICSFSGLNDFDPEEQPPGGQTQSYGQEVKGPDAEKPSEGFRQFDTPGFLCNPEKGPFEGPFPPEESPEE